MWRGIRSNASCQRKSNATDDCLYLWELLPRVSFAVDCHLHDVQLHHSNKESLTAIELKQSCFPNEHQLRFQIAECRPIFYDAQCPCTVCILILILIPSLYEENLHWDFHLCPQLPIFQSSYCAIHGFC